MLKAQEMANLLLNPRFREMVDLDQDAAGRITAIYARLRNAAATPAGGKSCGRCGVLRQIKKEMALVFTNMLMRRASDHAALSRVRAAVETIMKTSAQRYAVDALLNGESVRILF